MNGIRPIGALYVFALVAAYESKAQQHPLLPWIVPGLPPRTEARLSDAEKRGILDAVCPKSKRVRNAGKPGAEFLCTACPEGSQPAIDEGNASLRSVLAGHFTAPGAEERLAWFEGCGAMQAPGFSVLFQKNGDRWTMLWLYADTPLDLCRAQRRPGGRDLLLCYEGLRSRGFELGSLVQMELDRSGAQDRGGLYSVLTRAVRGNRCDLLTNTEQQGRLTDLNGDGAPDLQVALTVRQGAGRYDEARGECVPARPQAGTRYVLDFVFADGLFRATPETKRRVSLLEGLWHKGNPDAR